jgi:hypothetical protein
MFLRKVDRAFPDYALKEIMETDFGNAHLQLHNRATQKKDVAPLNIKLIIVCVFLAASMLGYLFLF